MGSVETPCGLMISREHAVSMSWLDEPLVGQVQSLLRGNSGAC